MTTFGSDDDYTCGCDLDMVYTNRQIETFTQGCKQLKCVYLNDLIRGKCNKLFYYLGKYSSFLEILHIRLSFDTETMSEVIKTESLKYLAKGCPCLRVIKFSCLTLSTEGISNLVAFGKSSIESLALQKCDISDDALTEIGKLQQLKALSLTNIPNITDQGITNLVRARGHHLEDIYISFCPHLSNTSLFAIAANCPNLNKIYASDSDKFTHQGLFELFDKCHNLGDINYLSCIYDHINVVQASTPLECLSRSLCERKNMLRGNKS